ncbi:MAG TPA: ComEC/Rec2 family competence protein [Chthonomonadaceae bacterium]|nr:ComEC/Rec2 family competence protein [Chthonomonadaceae bacterium]
MHARSVGKLLLCALAVVLLVGWGTSRRAPSGELRITFLDVGQGDGAVIETPSHKVVVVDTGGLLENGDDEGRRVVAPFLRYRGINRIDLLVLSHPHADHIGGAATLLHRFPVGLLMDNGEPEDSPLVTQILTLAHQDHVPYVAAHRGQTIDFGDGVTAQVLSPTAEEAQGPANDASVVLRLRYGRTAFLLTGDAEAPEEEDMLRSGQPLACDVLKVCHHGSDTSTTPAFLAAAHPHIALISVGAHNVYGLPGPKVIERLKASGTRVYRTDMNGALTCLSDGVSVHAEPMLP